MEPEFITCDVSIKSEKTSAQKWQLEEEPLETDLSTKGSRSGCSQREKESESEIGDKERLFKHDPQTYATERLSTTFEEDSNTGTTVGEATVCPNSDNEEISVLDNAGFTQERNVRETEYVGEPYECQDCGKVFNNSSSLKRHHRIHTTVTDYICDDCGKTFKQARYLKIHMRIHLRIKPHVCQDCGKAFGRVGHLRKHQQLHKDGKYACKECGKSYNVKSNYINHQKTHLGVKNYSCGVCSNVFLGVSELKRHLKTHTGLSTKKKILRGCLVSLQQREPVEGSLESCIKQEAENASFVNPETYAEDRAARTTGQEERASEKAEEGQRGLNSTLNLSITQDTSATVTESDLTDGKRYICDECGKSFAYPSVLKRHLMAHAGLKPYTCEECGKSFIQLCHLKVHQRTHLSVKPYVCDECGKSFTQAWNLKEHQRTHAGVKLHTCDECGKLFTQAGNLKEHRRIHLGIRPYTCDECGKSFIRICNLKEHQLIHRGVKDHTCDECGKSFIGATKLRIHKRSHSGVKPYACQECSKSFSQYGHLQAHTRTHTGEKPYSCEFCAQPFTTSGALNHHKAAFKCTMIDTNSE